MAIPITRPPTEIMMRGLARFSHLHRCMSGLPDMELPEGKRAFLNVLGFDQPDSDGKQYSPFGDQAKPAVSHLKAGFGISFIAAEPGKGVVMHTHDTVETFMSIKGSWTIEWEGPDGVESVVLAPLDFMACPVGVQRRFECFEPAAGEREGLLLGMVEGNSPAGEYSPEAVERLIAAGLVPATQSNA
jgi:mannose-6-phosphate isomerase-like protein (cupin superfamily)